MFRRSVGYFFYIDMDVDIYLSPYGKSRTSKSKKIKTFAVQKLSQENPKSDHIVVAANDTNEISVTFNEGSDCKVFSFDKVLCDDESQVVLYDSLLKSVVQDVVMGLNSFLILCNLTYSNKISALHSKCPFPGMLPANSLLKNILKHLLIYTTNEENFDSSLHASFFEVHDDRIVDLLNKTNETVNLKTLKVFQQNFMEIKDLTERPIVNENDIADIFSKQSHNLLCCSSICHSIFIASLIKKNESYNEFDSMKIGKLFVVDFAKCRNNVLGPNIYADCGLKIPEDVQLATSSKNQLFDILKPAFGGSARTILVVPFCSYLHSPERDWSLLRFIDQLQNVYNYPEIEIKRIIPTSLTEYSKEIQELQKDLAAIKQKTGVKVEPALYRCLKNSATVEEEKSKILCSYLSFLRESNTSKKQNLISTHSTSEQIENEIKEEEKQFETLNLELKKLQGQDDFKQKCSDQASEIIKMKQMKNINISNLKKLKSDLIETQANYNEITRSLKSVNADLVSISSDMESEKSFLKETLVLLVNDMQSALPQLQTQHYDLMRRLNSLSTVDELFDTWKINTENMLTKVSDFIEEQNKNFDSSNFKMLTPIVPVQTLKSEVVKIIESNKIENVPMLFCFVQKCKGLSGFLFKTLAEILSLLDAVQNCYKTELTTLGAIISSSNKALKKFFNDIDSVLKLSQQYSKELGSEAKDIADLVSFHHKFKKHFDGQLNDIKQSILMLKQSYLIHNDVAVSKWNEVQKSCLKTSQKHSDISKNLSLIKNQMSLHLSKTLQKVASSDCLQLKEEAKNVQKKAHQLLEIQDEMTGIFDAAAEIDNKGMDKEMQEVKKFTDSQKIEVEKCFNSYYLKMKGNFTSFMIDLHTLLNLYSNNKEDMEDNFGLLSSSVSSLATFYDNYKDGFKNIYGKSESVLKKLPPVFNITVAENEDNLPGLESIYLDDWKVMSSTPKTSEARKIDIEFEKEKLLGRIRSVVEQQMSQKLNVPSLDNDGKEANLSTMSLPNFGSNRSKNKKASSQTSENVFKAKSSRK